jgi:hypothetical protein
MELQIFIGCNFLGITQVLAEDEGFEPSIAAEYARLESVETPRTKIGTSMTT